MVYILLIIGPGEMSKVGLAEYIPKKKKKSESTSLASTVNKDINNWDFSHIKPPDEKAKKNMVAIMVQIMVLVLTATTCYKFAGVIYRQKQGLGIGLRGSAALARITMCAWDRTWGKLQLILGLTVQIFCRYVDDLRFYLRPITRGWFWRDKRWVYDKEEGDRDERDPELRTADEIGKSLSDIWDFVQFTTEREAEFNDKFLPTLDFATKVEGNGYIRYKFFSKPMSSNLLLMNGTALSKSCVFSSLRQDLVRRLINTDYLEGINCRLEIINRFIQLMVNSGHKFQYLKSVVLQAISKYVYMIQRSNVEISNKIYCPLHRGRTYKQNHRKLLKYTNQAMWFSNDKPGDKFKDTWKWWIKRKGSNKHKILNKNGSRKERKNKKQVIPNTTTVMFIPKTHNGRLMEMIQNAEDKLTVGWRTKIVEKPGIPLYKKFNKSFTMVSGCARGQMCKVCDNLGTKCTQKGVVYKAVCLDCHQDDLNKGTYIGETSRQFGTRVTEHFYNLSKWRKESFMICHWMEQHSTQTTPPQFKFSVISSHKDALSRQLSEAIHIRSQGNLNKRNEFSINELVRLEAAKYSWDLEVENKAERDREREYCERINNFIAVMSSVWRLSTNTPKNKSNCMIFFQNFKRSSTPQSQERSKRSRMEASTPTQYREHHQLDLSQSPIEIGQLGGDITEGIQATNDSSNLDQDGRHALKSTGVSGETSRMEVTPPKPEPKELTLARDNIARSEFCQSEDNFRTRSNSAPILREKIVREAAF